MLQVTLRWASGFKKIENKHLRLTVLKDIDYSIATLLFFEIIDKAFIAGRLFFLTWRPMGEYHLRESLPAKRSRQSGGLRVW
ncbi:MAG TPA: hypothetical protein VF823_08485 [Anaerolineales bacterium]